MLEAVMTRGHRRWHRERIAKLGFLVGLGLDAKAVGEDPTVDASPGQVYEQARRFGIAFRDAPNVSLDLPAAAMAVFDAEAKQLGYTRDGLIRQALTVLAADPTLIRNVLDDGR